MSYLHAIVLGLVQGLGEFLPISSSGHLILVPYIFGWEKHGDIFDISLHLGTLIAVFGYFWRDIIMLLRAGFSTGKSDDKKLFWMVIIATIPAGLIGYFFEGFVEETLRTAVLSIALAMGVVGILLVMADKISRKQNEITKIGIVEAVVIGLSQSIALLPGVSRSGATMTSGLLFGLKREAAARFSFLMSVPIILGAGLVNIKDLRLADLTGPFIVGCIVAAFVGYVSIGWLLKYLNRGSYAIFAWYRLAFALLVITLIITRG